MRAGWIRNCFVPVRTHFECGNSASAEAESGLRADEGNAPRRCPYLRSDPREARRAGNTAQRSGRYSKMKRDVAFRLKQAETAGLDFALSPKIADVVRIVREK
jgi:hypothetical protein